MAVSKVESHPCDSIYTKVGVPATLAVALGIFAYYRFYKNATPKPIQGACIALPPGADATVAVQARQFNQIWNQLTPAEQQLVGDYLRTDFLFQEMDCLRSIKELGVANGWTWADYKGIFQRIDLPTLSAIRPSEDYATFLTSHSTDAIYKLWLTTHQNYEGIRVQISPPLMAKIAQLLKILDACYRLPPTVNNPVLRILSLPALD